MKAEVMDLVQQRYADFGPKLVAEKLLEQHDLMDAGLWKAKRKKKAKLYQSRQRRACFGELIQLNGSHHNWKEQTLMTKTLNIIHSYGRNN